jgi:hypothetical protein
MIMNWKHMPKNDTEIKYTAANPANTNVSTKLT